MKTRHIIAIGILSAITIGLIAFGLKTKNFKKPMLTSAEDLYPISTKWLMNKSNLQDIPNEETVNFTTWLNDSNYRPNRTDADGTATKINSQKLAWYYYSGSYGPTGYAWIQPTGTTQQKVWYNSTEAPNNHTEYPRRYVNNASRIIEFASQPTGSIYTMLNNNATPAYNSDILTFTAPLKRYYENGQYNYFYKYKDTGINEIRKDSLPISLEDVRNGKFITTEGTIQLFIDAGCTSLKINEVEYINALDTPINITNNDIVIETTGTNSGNTYAVFTINYFNTRPPITPQPYPDPGNQVIEVIPIVPMMFQILTMPFTFITTAFNVTLWEGTPYQFNFSNFIYSLIAIATLIFIIKLFTSGFSVIGNYTYNKADKDFKKSQTRLNNAKAGNIERNAPKKTESKVTIKKE